MAAQFTGLQHLRSLANLAWHGATTASLSMWVEFKGTSQAAQREAFLFARGGYDTLYGYTVLGQPRTARFQVSGSGVSAGHNIAFPADVAAHVAVVLDAGVVKFYQSGVLVHSEGFAPPLGPGGTPTAKPFSVGLDPQGGYDPGSNSPVASDVVLSEPTCWEGHALTPAQIVAIRDRTSAPTAIAPSAIVWAVTLAGTAGATPVLGQPGLADGSANDLDVATITGTPAYRAQPTYVPPVRLKRAIVAPSRKGIVLQVETTTGAKAPVAALGPAPTFRFGGVVTDLGDPVWGRHGSQPAFADWLYWPVPAGIAVGDSITVSAPDAWVTTPVGNAGAFAATPVDTAIRATIHPEIDDADIAMTIGYNVNTPSPDEPISTYQNLVKGAGPWLGGTTATFDSAGHILTSDAVGMAAILKENGPNYRDQKGYPVNPNGVYTLQWRGANTYYGIRPDGNPGDFLDAMQGPYGEFPELSSVVLPSGKRRRTFQVRADFTKKHGATMQLIAVSNGTAAPYSYDGTLPELFGPGVNPDAPGKFNTHFLRMLGEDVACIRFMECFGTNSCNLVDAEDYNDDSLMSIGRNRRPYGGAVQSIAPYTDSTGRYAGKGVPILVTFTAPHGIKDGQNGSIAIDPNAGPNGNATYPTVGGGATSSLYLGYELLTPINATQATFSHGNAAGTLLTTYSGAALGPSGMKITGSLPSHYPIGDMTELCNLKKNACLWMNFGHAVTNACVTAKCTEIAQKLNGKMRLEYSNEPWNTTFGFLQAGYMEERGKMAGLSPMAWYAKRAAEVHALARAAFVAAGRPATDVIRVMGTFGGFAPGGTTPIADYCQANGIAFDELAVGPYLNNAPGPGTFSDGSDQLGAFLPIVDALDIDQLMDLSELYVEDGYDSGYVAAHRAILDARGFQAVDIVAYEGGPERGVPVYASPDVAYARRSHAWAHHPRMRTVLRRFFYKLQEAGCKLFNVYTLNYFLAGDGAGSQWATYYGAAQLAGRGDGSDGKFDNRSNFEDLRQVVSVAGFSYDEWQAAASGATDPPDEEDPPTPVGPRLSIRLGSGLAFRILATA